MLKLFFAIRLILNIKLSATGDEFYNELSLSSCIEQAFLIDDNGKQWTYFNDNDSVISNSDFSQNEAILKFSGALVIIHQLSCK